MPTPPLPSRDDDEHGAMPAGFALTIPVADLNAALLKSIAAPDRGYGWSSPLDEIVVAAVRKHVPHIETAVFAAIGEALADPVWKAELRDAMKAALVEAAREKVKAKVRAMPVDAVASLFGSPS